MTSDAATQAAPAAAADHVVVVFDDTCGICQRAVRFVKVFDWLRRFHFEGYSTAFFIFPEIAGTDMDEGVRARFPDGSVAVGIDAVRSIAMRTPLGALVAWTLYIPPIRWVGRKVYCWIAERRHTACRLVPGGRRG